MEIGLSVDERQLNRKDFYGEARDAGISLLEISLHNRRTEQYDFTKAVREAEENGLRVWSVHLPFGPFEELDPSSLHEEKRRFTVERQQEVIKRAGDAGIRHYIVHASIEPIEVEERIFRMARAKESMKALADTAENAGGVLCVEDLPRTCLGRSSYDIRELLSADERLRCCFDTNHLLGEYIPEFIRNVGKKIVTTHISDYDFWNERHLLPGEGKIDWKELYETLLSTGYEGPWLYEVDFQAPWCVKRTRELTPADFSQNAREIFEGRPPVPVGKMIENMTFWQE